MVDLVHLASWKTLKVNHAGKYVLVSGRGAISYAPFAPENGWVEYDPASLVGQKAYFQFQGNVKPQAAAPSNPTTFPKMWPTFTRRVAPRMLHG